MVVDLLATNASRRSWKIAIGAIGSVVVLIQVWAASNLLNRTGELRTILSTSQTAANQLERSIGYGGLIHNFKNYILRPDEDEYRLSAEENARKALVLIEELRANAFSYGIVAQLENTREMVMSYAERLERVRQLVMAQRSRAFIDDIVRLDDQPALIEVQALINQLNEAIDNRLTQLQREAAFATVVIFVCTIAAGILFIVCFATRQKRHFQAVKELADRLSNTNESLSRANCTLNQFAGIVSHDLKGPLNHIIFFSAQVAENLDDAQVANGSIDRIQGCVDNMNQIIDSLLDFSRTGFTQPHFESVDLPSLLAELAENLQSEIQESSALLIIDLPVGQIVQADSALLARVFNNLITNSLKYRQVHKAPKIEIRGNHSGDYIELSVSDNGIGIDPQFSDKIFEPLQRLHGSQDEYTGSGIGLSLVKSIIEGHLGQIHLDTNYTNGTRIVFTLPCPASLPLANAA